ncbi:hypothetical protein [Ideonella paludis]|uniref:Uncharacterized protein n=1 Tax=Ideonella paludis TaxID=1233411 RepID=A0ABS5DZ78_9BURK|nr:hypothetical protein [Ideonella paludis]MBQ0936458.1 hypothetical protein [Ideonella paludis]
MTYQPTSLKEVPRETEFLQDLALTPLQEAELSRKYGFVFEQTIDDLSSCEVCVVKGEPSQYFLIVCRGEIPEWKVTIRTSRSAEPIETYVPRMLASFVEAADFDVQDIDHLWSFKQ